METTITGMGTKLVFLGQNASPSEFQHTYPVNCKPGNCLSNAIAQSRPMWLQKAEIWTCKSFCVRRQEAQVTKKVSRKGEAVKLDASIRSSFEKQTWNPEAWGAERFQCSSVEKEDTTDIIPAAGQEVIRAQGVIRARAVSHSGAHQPTMRGEMQGSNRAEELTQRTAVWLLIICIYAKIRDRGSWIRKSYVVWTLNIALTFWINDHHHF